MTEPFAWSLREYLPGTDQKLPGGGIRAMRVNTKYYKDNMAMRLSKEPETPGCVQFYATAGEEYCKQLTSEARDDKGNWKPIGSRPNHYWDNWMAVNALADWLGVRHRPDPGTGQDDEKDDDEMCVVAANSTFMG